MRIAISGHNGQVVQALRERAANAHVDIITFGRPDVDFQQPKTIEAALLKIQPDAIVNSAAYTAVDQAEAEPEIAYQINCVAAGMVAETARKLSVPVIQLSTDYVFDGTLDRPYRESDLTNPKNAYGKTKLAGEQAVSLASDNHVILRTSWLYSPYGMNFAKKMFQLSETRSEISVVKDQIGGPTNALDVADGLITILRKMLAAPDNAAMRGTFHLSNSGETNWADFARTIFQMSSAIGGPTADVKSIPTSAYKTPALRPSNSLLNNEKIKSVFGIGLNDWKTSLAAIMNRLVRDNLESRS